MTFVDIVLFLMLLVMVYIGFSAGLLKVLTVIIGMYGGFQVAALFYTIFANITATPGDPNSALTSQIVWFFVLWLVWSIIFTLVAWSFIGTITLPKWLSNIELLGGLILGLLAAVFAMSIFGIVMRNVVIMTWYGSGQPAGNWLDTLRLAFKNSFLISLFNSIRYVYLNLMSPWLPANTQSIFELAGR